MFFDSKITCIYSKPKSIHNRDGYLSPVQSSRDEDTPTKKKKHDEAHRQLALKNKLKYFYGHLKQPYDVLQRYLEYNTEPGIYLNSNYV